MQENPFPAQSPAENGAVCRKLRKIAKDTLAVRRKLFPERPAGLVLDHPQSAVTHLVGLQIVKVSETDAGLVAGQYPASPEKRAWTPAAAEHAGHLICMRQEPGQFIARPCNRRCDRGLDSGNPSDNMSRQLQFDCGPPEREPHPPVVGSCGGLRRRCSQQPPIKNGVLERQRSDAAGRH